jgi:hypothetical protein
MAFRAWIFYEVGAGDEKGLGVLGISMVSECCMGCIRVCSMLYGVMVYVVW